MDNTLNDDRWHQCSLVWEELVKKDNEIIRTIFLASTENDDTVLNAVAEQLSSTRYKRAQNIVGLLS